MTSQPPFRSRVPGLKPRSCREAVWHDIQAYSCELPDLHAGPHMSQSHQPSVQARKAWEEANPDLVDASEPDPFLS